jgi:hypothetical protein
LVKLESAVFRFETVIHSEEYVTALFFCVSMWESGYSLLKLVGTLLFCRFFEGERGLPGTIGEA